MFCPECGTENKENSKFCKKCGTPLNEDSVPKNDSPKEVQNKQNQSFLNKNTKIIIATIIIIAIIAVGVIYIVSTSSAGQAVSFAGKDFYIPQDAKITDNETITENNYNSLIITYTSDVNNVSIGCFDNKKVFANEYTSSIYDMYPTKVNSELPVTVYKDSSTGCYAMLCEIDGHYFNVMIFGSSDDKALQEYSEFCKLNPNLKDYTYSANSESSGSNEPAESEGSSVTVEFDEKFETQTSEGAVWQHTGSKDIGDGDTMGIIYMEGYDDQSGENYPFMVQGYTSENGPGLLHHTITKVVYYYEENGQTVTETRDGEGLINVEPPKKPIKVVVYYN